MGCNEFSRVVHPAMIKGRLQTCVTLGQFGRHLLAASWFGIAHTSDWIVVTREAIAVMWELIALLWEVSAVT